jgi:hypothetical protein
MLNEFNTELIKKYFFMNLVSYIIYNISIFLSFIYLVNQNISFCFYTVIFFRVYKKILFLIQKFFFVFLTSAMGTLISTKLIIFCFVILIRGTSLFDGPSHIQHIFHTFKIFLWVKYTPNTLATHLWYIVYTINN